MVIVILYEHIFFYAKKICEVNFNEENFGCIRITDLKFIEDEFPNISKGNIEKYQELFKQFKVLQHKDDE